MASQPVSPYHTAKRGPAVAAVQGEYTIFRYAPMLESDFTRASKRGQVTDVHNRVHMVTVDVFRTSLHLVLPEVVLLATQRQQAYTDLRAKKAASLGVCKDIHPQH